MKLLHMIKCNLRRAVVSKRFLIAVLFIAIFEYMDSFFMIYDNIKYETIRGVSGYTLVQLLIGMGSTMFWGISLTLALMPYSHAFIEDLDNRSVTYITIRSSRGMYAATTVIACGISAFLCSTLGKSLFLLMASINCAPCSQRCLEMYGDYITSLSQGDYWGFIIGNIVLSGLRGAFFALIGLLVSCIAKNKMVIFAMPILVYYFFIKIINHNLKLPNYFNIIAIYFTYVFEEKYEVFSILYAFLFTVCVGILTSYVINGRIRRCY